MPAGYNIRKWRFPVNDWSKILFNSVVWSRLPHTTARLSMTGAAICATVRGTSCGKYAPKVAHHAAYGAWSPAAVLMPARLLFGHLCGEYVSTTISLPKMASAIEGMER